MAKQKRTRKQTEKRRAEKDKLAIEGDDKRLTKGQELEDHELDRPEKKKAEEAEITEDVRIIAPMPEADPEEIAPELRPEFPKAVQAAMTLFDQFIIYEQDAPEEARIQLFPAFMHLKQEDIDAQILKKYNPAAEVAFGGSLEDLKLIIEGIDDAISILKKRSDNAFPTPGARELRDLEFEALSKLAYTEAALFYRMQPDDLIRGHITLSSKHAIKANQPAGTRLRWGVPVQTFAKIFIDVLADDSHEDMLLALMQHDEVRGTGYAMYFQRWREAELI